MSDLPKIASPALPEFLELAKKMEGKTRKKIEYGCGEYIRGAHETEVLILKFTDGTKVGISIGSNAMEFKRLVNPEKLKVDFMFDWDDE